MQKCVKSVNWVATLVILSTVPGIWHLGLEREWMALRIVEWIGYGGVITSSLGLYWLKEWARQWSIRFLILYALWIFYVICFLIGPSFSEIIEWVSAHYFLGEDLVRQVCLVLIIAYLFWPMIVIFFLIHPRVKCHFDPNYDPAQEET